jgi:hypothetical protein
MENPVIGASVVLIIASPWLGQMFNLDIIQNILVRFLLLAFVIVGIRQGPMAGLLAFLAAFSLLIERNHQVLTKFPNQIPIWPSGEKSGKQGPPSYAPPLLPVTESHSYEPPHSEEHASSDQSYESASDIQDSNPRLDEVAQGEAAGSFYEQKGLA